MRNSTSLNSGGTTQKAMSRVTCYIPGSGRVVTTGYPDPVPGEIPYPSHLYK